MEQREWQELFLRLLESKNTNKNRIHFSLQKQYEQMTNIDKSNSTLSLDKFLLLLIYTQIDLEKLVNTNKKPEKKQNQTASSSPSKKSIRQNQSMNQFQKQDIKQEFFHPVKKNSNSLSHARTVSMGQSLNESVKQNEINFENNSFSNSIDQNTFLNQTSPFNNSNAVDSEGDIQQKQITMTASPTFNSQANHTYDKDDEQSKLRIANIRLLKENQKLLNNMPKNILKKPDRMSKSTQIGPDIPIPYIKEESATLVQGLLKEQDTLTSQVQNLTEKVIYLTGENKELKKQFEEMQVEFI